MICLKFLFFGEKCLINTILYFYFLQWIFYPLMFSYLLLIGFEISLLYKINIFGLPRAYFHCITYKLSNWNCRPFTTWIIIDIFLTTLYKSKGRRYVYFFNNIYVGSLANHIDILFGAFASYSLVPNSRERCSCKFWGKTPQDYLIIRREWPINECPLLILKNLNDFSAGVFYSTPYYQAQKSTFKLDVWFDTFATLTVYLLQCLTFATNINTYVFVKNIAH